MSSQRRQPSGRRTYKTAEGVIITEPIYPSITGFLPVQQPRASSSQRSTSSARLFSQTASQQQLKQGAPGSNPTTQTKNKPGRSNEVVPYSVYNNDAFEQGGRKKKPVSKPKKKKMTSTKNKKQTRK